MPSVISPSSFMTGNAPGGVSYAAPLVNFQQLAQLPEDYYRGTQEARTLALQNAFPNGLPTGPDGKIDVNRTVDTLTRIGGAEAVQALLPSLIQRQLGDQAAAGLAGGTPSIAPPPPAQPSPAPPTYGKGGPNASPANIVGNQPQQPQLSSTGADERGGATDNEAPTIRSLATEIFPRQPGQDQDVMRLITAYSSRTGIRPDSDLTPQQAQDFTSWAGRVKLAGQMGGQQRPPQTPVQNEDPSASGAPTSGTSAQDRQINGVNAAPIPGGGTSGAPAPPAGPGGSNPATAAARAIVPRAWWGREQEYAQQRFSEARNYEAAGTSYAAINPALAKGYTDYAAQLRQEGNSVLDALKGGAAFSPEVQQAEIEKAGEQKRQEGLIAAGQKQYEGISANARSYETQQKGWLDTARSLFSQPELYTGVGSNMSQFVNRVKAAFANDPKGAEYQAVLGKVNAANILNTINQQKFDMLETGSNAGRIFAGQIDQAEKTSPGVENTLEANRALVELQTRVGKMNSEFARQAREYLNAGHKYLDVGFDAKLSKWIEQHPLLSPAEISNPSLLGVPYIPPNRNTPEKVVNWAHAMGLNEGDPIRTADGRLGRVPRLHIPVPVQTPVQAGGVPAANAATPPQGVPTP